MIRYPLAPLAEAIGVDTSRLARILGLSGSTWKEYRDHGVTERVADRLAVKAGFHPYEIWPDWGLAVCADERCAARFAPPRRDQVFCTRACKRRHHERMRQRRLYGDPAYRARKQAVNAAYKAEVRDAAQRRQRKQGTAA